LTAETTTAPSDYSTSRDGMDLTFWQLLTLFVDRNCQKVIFLNLRLSFPKKPKDDTIKDYWHEHKKGLIFSLNILHLTDYETIS